MRKTEIMATGILGGTFDPPHCGHLGIAEAAITSGHVDRVLLIPTSTPPHKQRKDITPDKHRLRMAEILCQNNNNISVSDIEIRRQGLSYTIYTIDELIELNPEEEFHLIIGADMAQIFGTWKEAEAIIDKAAPLIAYRPGYTFDTFSLANSSKQLSAEYQQRLLSNTFEAPLIDISSTELRDAICRDDTELCSKYIDKNIMIYIKENNLYK